MKTRISKHGKYEIMEGVEREVGDMLQPGDLLTANSVEGASITVEVITRLKDREQYDEFKDKLTLLDRLTVNMFVVAGREQVFFDDNPYVVKAGVTYTLWTPAGDPKDAEAPVKIKRRIKQDTGIVADTVQAGSIHADSINGAKKVEEAAPKVPTEPGLYRDNQGDYVLFHRHVDSPTLLYTYFTLGGEVCVWHETVEAEYSGMLLGAAPFARVTAIKDVEVEQ